MLPIGPESRGNLAQNQPRHNEIMVGGFVPFTSIDFPNHLAAVIFCQGCTWRCSYCHNKHLQSLDSKASIPWQEIRLALKARQGFLDGVVFSGGEPLLQQYLEDAILDILDIKFKVAIHTGGSRPENLQKIIKLVHWVGFDVKAPFDYYDQVTKTKNSGDKAEKSLGIVLESGVDYEVRTTIDPSTFTENYILQIVEVLTQLGVKTFVLQAFQTPSIDPECISWQKKTFFKNDPLIAELHNKFENFSIRGI
ncbi:pyruvate formate lyase activating enzyme [Alphaproteobacteria bacterium]